MRRSAKLASIVVTLVGTALLMFLPSRSAAVNTSNFDYLAEAAVRQLADGWDVDRIMPMFAEQQRPEIAAEPVRTAVRSLQVLGHVQGVAEQFRTFSTMSQFSTGGGQTTITTATRAYLVQYAGGMAKVTVGMKGNGQTSDIILLHIRKMMPQPSATVSLGRSDGSVWSQFDSW